MTELAATIEAILFTAHGPLKLKDLTKLLEASELAVSAAVSELDLALAESGLRLSQHDDGLRLVTAPALSAVIAKSLAESGRAELTKPVLETLSIIAYRGPVSRSQIEAIRGVNSEVTLRNLLNRDLIKTAETKSVDRAPQYIVSTEFLDHFGLASTAELPEVVPQESTPHET